MGVNECFMHIKYSTTSAKFHFALNPEEREGKSFTMVKPLGTVSHALETV
jgi:hypothetical protein